MDITLDEVIELLKGIRDDIDYANEEALVDGGVLDSFDILQIISTFDEEFDISIPAKEIVPENFNSAEALHALVVRLAEED